MQQRTIFWLSVSLFFSLLLWGTYSALVYIGVPVHSAVLLSTAANEVLQGACDTSYLCRGLYGFFPFVSFSVERASPFLWYVVLSALLFFSVAIFGFVRSGTWRIRFAFAPWHAVLLLLGSIWLQFTTLGLGSVDGAPVQRLVEPLPGVYQNVSGEGLTVLQENFARLQDAGCLQRTGTFGEQAGVYNMRVSCIQLSFLTRVLSQVAFQFLLVFQFLVLGRALLLLLRVRPASVLSEGLLAASLGACGWLVIIWLLAIFHLLSAFMGWTLLVLVPALLWQHVWYWGRSFVQARRAIDEPVWSVQLLLVWLLVSYIALNFLTVVRPFPIGWDDLGSYLNRPRLMVSYGHDIFSMPTFQWEYLTSLGFLLFGYTSVFGATASMMINWLAGMLAIGSVFLITRRFLGPRTGVLSALLYYALPMVGHFSFADMKIDNAVFAMGTLATFCLLFAFLRDADDLQQATDPLRPRVALQWVVLAGVFTGFAFSMKATGIMVAMALGAVLLGMSLHWFGFLGIAALSVVVFASQHVLDITDVARRLLGEGVQVQDTFILLAFALVGCALLGAAIWRGWSRIMSALVIAAVFGGTFLAVIAPWVYHNNFVRGRIIPTHLELGAPNTVTPSLQLDATPLRDDRPVRALPPELMVDKSHPACVPSGHVEELDRYWGFREGWQHYATLPWRSVMNIDSVGYYVTTMPALLLFPLLLLLPYFWRRRALWLRWLTLATVFLVVQWMFLANGIPWYGIGMFLGLVVALEVFVARAPDLPNRIVVSVLIAVSLLSMFNMRLWQYDQQRNLLEYLIGKASYEVMRERTIPHYDDIADLVTQRFASMPERPHLYRVGTFIPYFIPRNLEVIAVSDHQLDLFHCLYQERDPVLTVRRLKALGFNSIIFDTNTATIERDSQGSLHQKVNAFVDFLNDPRTGLQLVVNDPGNGVAYLLIPDDAGGVEDVAPAAATP